MGEVARRAREQMREAEGEIPPAAAPRANGAERVIEPTAHAPGAAVGQPGRAAEMTVRVAAARAPRGEKLRDAAARP